MKPGYTIDQYGTTDGLFIYVYNWKWINEVGMACYYNEQNPIPAYEKLVAVFKVKPKPTL